MNNTVFLLSVIKICMVITWTFFVTDFVEYGSLILLVSSSTLPETKANYDILVYQTRNKTHSTSAN